MTVKMLSLFKKKKKVIVIFNAWCWYLESRMAVGRYMIQFHYGEWDTFCFISFSLLFSTVVHPCLCLYLIWISRFKKPTQLGMVDTYWLCLLLASFPSRSRESERNGGGVINVVGRLGLKRSRQSSAAAVLKIDFSYAILPNVCD